jgi:predicted DNA-binding protein
MMSFRVSEATVKRLAALAKYYGRGNTEIIEALIDEEIGRVLEKDHKEFKKSMKE